MCHRARNATSGSEVPLIAQRKGDIDSPLSVVAPDPLRYPHRFRTCNTMFLVVKVHIATDCHRLIVLFVIRKVYGQLVIIFLKIITVYL